MASISMFWKRNDARLSLAPPLGELAPKVTERAVTPPLELAAKLTERAVTLGSLRC